MLKLSFTNKFDMGNFLSFIGLLSILQLWVYPATAQKTVANSAEKPGNAQEVCGTALLHDKLMLLDENYRNRIRQNESLLQAVKAQNDLAARSTQANNQLLVIPVVVHIIHIGEAVGVGNNISDAQVNSAITALNNMYRKKAGTYGDGGGVDMEIEFQLATRDPNCNPTTGIVRVNGSSVPNYATMGVKSNVSGADEIAIKNLSRWPNTDYYNIWVVSEIENNNGGSGIQGYAYFPGAPASLDGTIVINSAFGTTGTVKSYTNRGQTLAHEMGHAFNLYHTFEGDGTGSSCPPVINGCGTGQGDCIADTEPHKRSNSTCPVGTTNTCTNAAIGNVYKNYMDYSSQTCSNEFTTDQKDRVRTAISQLRPGLLSSQGLSTSSISIPLAASCSPSGTVLSNNFGYGIYRVGVGSNLVISDGSVNENASLVDHTCNQQFMLDGNTSFSLAISTGPANNENVKVYLDYNNNGSFADAGELILTSNNTKTHSGTITPLTQAAKNTPLRLRIISDRWSNTIVNACYVPIYGQVEEYSVSFITPLPVSLTAFSARKEQKQVILNWETAQELNSSYFEIERAADSKEWETMGKINGAGNSNAKHTYTFEDAQPLQGLNYYRLKQVDFNGKFEYSPIRSVKFDEATAAVLVFPNPGPGHYTVQFGSQPAQPVHLRVYDLNGRLVYRQETQSQNAITFTIENEPAGLYMLEVSNGNTVNRVKLIKE